MCNADTFTNAQSCPEKYDLVRVRTGSFSLPSLLHTRSIRNDGLTTILKKATEPYKQRIGSLIWRANFFFETGLSVCDQLI